MKQVIQNFRSGVLKVDDVPETIVKSGGILVRNVASLISAGTEKMAIDLAQKSLAGKAKERPDLVRQVLNKVKRDGFVSTFHTVKARLETPLALGYSCAGVVREVGRRAEEFQVGDRVACAGMNYASHAETVFVPTNLAVKIPDGVSFDEAAFVTLGAIAMQGVRTAEVKLGEAVAVIGLGLVGQLTVQILKAAGCRVIGVDLDPAKTELARLHGADAAVLRADDVESAVDQFTGGYGVDGVIITAAADTNDPIELAGAVARDRAIISMVGAVRMDVPRKVYYEKELQLRLSRSYGPGRYDAQYEEQGIDYPIGYVRWTERRNMQEFLRLIAAGAVRLDRLITHRFEIGDAEQAYDIITCKDLQAFLGILLTYPEAQTNGRGSLVVELGNLRAQSRGEGAVRLGVIGAGNFATATLLPAIKRNAETELIGVCTATGLKARHAGNKFRFRYCTTDESEILSDSAINTVVISTRHHMHANQVIGALNAGKHVFCEKPLCLSESQLKEIISAYSAIRNSQSAMPLLMVGFNRRFAPMARQLQAFLSDAQEPVVMHYRVNVGYIPPDHWIHDPEQGGGRILGEVCHFVDFLTFLAGALPAQANARGLSNDGRYKDDNVVITLEFANGSLGSITYVANGDKSFPKERVEVFGGGAVAVLDDFRRLELVRHGRKKVYRSRLRQDKGHRGEWEAFAAAIKNGGPPPIAFTEIVSTTLTAFRIIDSLRCGEPLRVEPGALVAPALATANPYEAAGRSAAAGGAEQSRLPPSLDKEESEC